MMARSMRSRPLAVFFLLAFVVTWAVWVPRAAGVELGAVGQLWTWVPAAAALIAAVLTGGGAGPARSGRGWGGERSGCRPATWSRPGSRAGRRRLWGVRWGRGSRPVP